jgi:hypothetical protein
MDLRIFCCEHIALRFVYVRRHPCAERESNEVQSHSSGEDFWIGRRRQWRGLIDSSYQRLLPSDGSVTTQKLSLLHPACRVLDDGH